MAVAQLNFQTGGCGLTDITSEIAAWVSQQGAGEGLLTLFIRHTSASLVVQENADPDVLADLQDFFSRLAPWAEGMYRHTFEGPDDMPAHIRAALTQTSLSIPVMGGRLALGTWQGVYIWEHRARGARREIALHLGA